MKVIFLDFDGVLNSVQYHVQRVRDGLPHHDQAGGPCLDPAAVKVLNGIVERTGAVVVVSSTWRRGSTRVQLASWLREAGFEGIVLGSTPHLGTRRGHEVQRFLDWARETPHRQLGPLTHFVILDDDTDMEHLYPKLVHIDDERGLTEDYVPRILSHLEGT